jgi:uncharacterized protein
MYSSQILTAPLGDFEPVVAGNPNPRQRTWEWGYGPDVEVGIWECTPGVMDGTNTDFDEMMCMVSGRVTVQHDLGTYDIAPGTLWATPRNWASTWTIHETVRKLYVIDHRVGGPAPAAHLPDAHTVPVGQPVAYANPMGGNPEGAEAVLWAYNYLEIGVWEGTPGTFAINRDGYDEVFLCLSGAGTLTSSDGIRFDIQPGSALFTPEGFRGTWNITEPLRKVYCTIQR